MKGVGSVGVVVQLRKSVASVGTGGALKEECGKRGDWWCS